MIERHDVWFFLAMGTCFVVFAKPYGRALGYGLEGPFTSEERARDACRHTVMAHVLGVSLIAFAGWLLIR